MRGAGDKRRGASRGSSASGGPAPRSSGGTRQGTGRGRPDSRSDGPSHSSSSRSSSGRPPAGRSSTGRPTGGRTTGGRTTGGRPTGGRSGGRPDTRGSGGRGRPEARGGRTTGRPRPESLEDAGAPRSSAPRTGGRGRPDSRSGSGRGRPPAGNKRTSRNTDDRNPTRSGIQYPSPRYRRKDEPDAAPTAAARPALRKVRRGPDRGAMVVDKQKRTRKAPASQRRRLRSTEASEELRQLAGRGANRAIQELARAAEAVNAGHERDAARILRPLRDAYPDAAAVRELLGLVHYRLGQYPAAARELGAFADLTGSVEQHPVLMDCARAQKKYAKVASLWEELATSSPSAALVSEGRIVMAGSLADRGRLRDAVAMLERRGGNVQRPAEHHLPRLVHVGRPLRAHRRPAPGPRALRSHPQARPCVRRRRRASRRPRLSPSGSLSQVVSRVAPIPPIGSNARSCAR